MAGTSEGQGPTYISSHSAEVILSDIRPIKLKIEALLAINVLLDEFLYNILSASRSLATDKLRAGLLKILPTSLGKEALLEAEVELRAYWDRTTGGVSAIVDDTKNFHLQWAFELLRLKCEAYSTLNESDEDSNAEVRLHERMGKSGGAPPKPSLVAPAALYLTAILESLCEHILSNLGRVAARDSSRTFATIQDLFVALCEDDSIYTLFKSLKVYEQIENLSKVPKPRRSRSFNRGNERSTTVSRTSSRQQEPPSSFVHQTSPVSQLRISSDTSAQAAGGAGPQTVSRPSFDRSRGIKVFTTNSKNLADRNTPDSAKGDSRTGHRRSNSVLSYEDSEAGSEEFDNLMRSNSTMKVSLTPDRLKTMELYNKEKSRGSIRKRKPDLRDTTASNGVDFVTSSGIPPSSEFPSRTRNSIQEDGQNGRGPKPSQPRQRQASVTSPPITPPVAVSRFRSASTSGTPSSTRHLLTRNGSKKDLNGPSSYPAVMSTNTLPKRHDSKPLETSPMPARIQTVIRSQESIDLDDVTGDSGDDASDEVLVVATKPPKRQHPHAVSAAARELIDFLADGPPGESLNRQPHSTNSDLPKSKPSGRLQKMLSKLSIGSDKQSRAVNGIDESSKSTMRRLGSPMSTSLSSKRSYPHVGIANYPVPPRPRPVSPPISSHSQESSELPYTLLSPKPSSPRKTLPAWEQKSSPDTQGLSASYENSGSQLYNAHGLNGLSNGMKDEERSTENTTNVIKQPPSPTDSATGSAAGKRLSSSATKYTNGSKVSPVIPTVTPAEKTLELSANDAADIRRLMSNATNVDECRIIVDMFLAKAGHVADVHSPSPLPLPSDGHGSESCTNNIELEYCLLELLLGGGSEDASDVHDALKENPDVSEPLTKAHLLNESGTPPLGKDTPATEWLRRFAVA